MNHGPQPEQPTEAGTRAQEEDPEIGPGAEPESDAEPDGTSPGGRP